MYQAMIGYDILRHHFGIWKYTNHRMNTYFQMRTGYFSPGEEDRNDEVGALNDLLMYLKSHDATKRVWTGGF